MSSEKKDRALLVKFYPNCSINLGALRKYRHLNRLPLGIKSTNGFKKIIAKLEEIRELTVLRGERKHISNETLEQVAVAMTDKAYRYSLTTARMASRK